jgi:hypothetical protein
VTLFVLSLLTFGKEGIIETGVLAPHSNFWEFHRFAMKKAIILRKTIKFPDVNGNVALFKHL